MKVMCIFDFANYAYGIKYPEYGEICVVIETKMARIIPPLSGYCHILDGYNRHIGFAVECFAPLSDIDGVEILEYEPQKEMV